MKKLICDVLLKMARACAVLVAISAIITPAAFAADPDPVSNTSIEDVSGTFQKPERLDFYGVAPEIVAFSGELSEEKTQVKDAYLAIAGDYLGPVTLQYKTIIAGGRPQFAYDTTKLGFDFTASTTYFYVGNPTIEFTGDKITVIFPAQQGLLYDYAIVEFTPY